MGKVKVNQYVLIIRRKDMDLAIREAAEPRQVILLIETTLMGRLLKSNFIKIPNKSPFIPKHQFGMRL